MRGWSGGRGLSRRRTTRPKRPLSPEPSRSRPPSQRQRMTKRTGTPSQRTFGRTNRSPWKSPRSLIGTRKSRIQRRYGKTSPSRRPQHHSKVKRHSTPSSSRKKRPGRCHSITVPEDSVVWPTGRRGSARPCLRAPIRPQSPWLRTDHSSRLHQSGHPSVQTPSRPSSPRPSQTHRSHPPRTSL